MLRWNPRLLAAACGGNDPPVPTGATAPTRVLPGNGVAHVMVKIKLPPQ